MKYLLGLDNGGTVIKAALFDGRGNQLASASGKVDICTPEDGFVERDMEELWKANVKVIRQVVEKSHIQPENIRGIGISGHGKGLYLLDKHGRPLGNGIVSTDNRAIHYESAFRSSDVKDKVRKANFQNILACQPVCLLPWIRDHEPERYASIGAILSVKDYIRYRLTRQIYAERTDISGTNLFHLGEGRYSEELLSWFGIEDLYEALPPVRDSCDDCGHISAEAAEETGLDPSTIVSGGLFDIDACALAMGVTDSRDVCVIAGTWSINEYIREDPVREGTGMNSCYCLPGYYLIEECSPTSAGNLEWVLKRFFSGEIESFGGMNESFYDWLNQSVSQVNPGMNRVIFLPFLFASNEGVGYQGTFLNLTAATTKAQIVEAVYEGIAFSHKTHVNRLLASKEHAGDVRLAGGISRSDVFCQMLADVLQQTVKTCPNREEGCFGAALTAGMACGLYDSVLDMVRTSVRMEHLYRPDPERGTLYQDKYRRYRAAVESLGAFYRLED